MAPYPSLSERSARLQDSSSQLFEALQFTDCGSADSFIERLLPSCHRQSHFLSHYQQFLPPLAKETLCHSKAKSTAKQSSVQGCAVSQSSLDFGYDLLMFFKFYIYSYMVLIRSYSWSAPLHAAVGQVPQGFVGIALATFQPGQQHFTQRLTMTFDLSYPACFFTAFSVFCMFCRLSTNLFLVWQLQER